MKNQFFISVLFLLLFSAFTLKAQDSTLIKIDKRFALQFQSQGLGYFNGYDGYGFAAKYHSGKFALRIGFEINSQKGDEEYNIKFQNRSLSKKSFEEKYSDIGFFAEGLYYFNVYQSLAAYTGAGLFYRILERKYGYPLNYNSSVREYRYELENTGYGISLLIGTEWFVRENIGISLEYAIKLSKYSSISAENNDEIDNSGRLISERIETESEGTKITHNSVRFGVAVYF